VIARALEKRPEDRYQTVSELTEDFTIAAGMEPASVSASAGHKPVMVAAGSASAEFDGLDEETLVRKRHTTPMVPPPPVGPEVPPPASSFDPWKILLPSVIGLLLIFGVIFAFTRNQSADEAQPGSTLAADPNGLPVEAASPATGRSEAGIPSGGITNPAGNPNINAEASPSPGELPSVDPNANANTNENTNKNPTLPTPVPSRTVIDEPPAPSPVATKTPVPKPTAAPPAATPAAEQPEKVSSEPPK